MKQKIRIKNGRCSKKHGVLHKRLEQVTDELFRQGDFFDPRDLVQVKYEMLRRIYNDKKRSRPLHVPSGFHGHLSTRRNRRSNVTVCPGLFPPGPSSLGT